MEIFIEGNVPSSKNSKIATRRGVFHSKTVKRYLQSLGVQHFSVSKKEVTDYKTKDNRFRPVFDKLGNLEAYPIKVGFHFVRGTKHKFDFHNVVQIIADLLVAHDIIEDDNMDYFIPVPYKKDGKYYTYDKENPGVWIKFYI